MAAYAHAVRRRKIIYGALPLVFVLTVVLCTAVGPASIGPAEVARILASRLPFLGEVINRNWPESAETIIFHFRLARVILAVLVGAALAGAGVVLQGLLQNPMADPYILGISSGAALGAALALLFGLGSLAFGVFAVPALAFIGAAVTALAVYHLARTGGRVPMTTLLLAGIAMGSFLSALTSLVMVISGENLHQVIFWLMGGFGGRGWEQVQVLLPYVVAGSLPLFLLARELNLLLLGEEPAQHLGVEVERLKQVLLGSATLLAASAVAVSGIIGFVGLIVPHAVRLLVGPDHRVLLPASIFAGAIFLAVADTLARVVAAPLEIPVGVITALCGGPFFLYLLRSKKGY